MTRIAIIACLLSVMAFCRPAAAQPEATKPAALQLLYIRASADRDHYDALKLCDDLTIARYRDMGVTVIEKTYADIAKWLLADGGDLQQAMSNLQYLGYAKAQGAQAIGGLAAVKLDASEAGWRKVEPGWYIYGWNINRAALTHQFLITTSGGMTIRAVPLYLAGSSKAPWAVANAVTPSTCQGRQYPVPDFTTNDINNQPIRFADYKGKVVLVDFWATWCHPCRDEFPILQALGDKLSENEFVWISVSVDEDDRAWRHFVHDNGLGGIQIRDAKAVWKRLFRVSDYPSAFVIDRDGVIRCKVRGDDIPQAVLGLLSKEKTTAHK